ncbi:exodeoxyribonuclease VII large subunit [Ilumatobacter sp.]|uniref:exodeoxyribonuclease VII large subunit n=1 Tax=Ilumatobacter sp. TaxID=1967498 RepID=UPI003B52AC14
MSQPAFDFDDGELDEPVDATFTVGELADAIDAELRRGFRDGVWVRGEINGLKRGGPHLYFSLVEKERASEAKLDVKLFAPALKRLTPKLRSNRLELRDGMKVRIHGHLDFYKPRGTLAVKMDDIDPRHTLGEIAQSRDDIMRRLVASGALDANRRHRVPAAPLRIGVVASVESAAWADFTAELERSGFGFELTVADTRVQGDGAERMVAGAIGTLARGARAGLLDVIVVIRGGGARNELATFDGERIARTIASVPIPVFTGLGHEIDRSVADEVAHTALKTPTACAGALVEQVERYVSGCELTWQAIGRAGEAVIDRSERRSHDVSRRIAARADTAVARSDHRLHDVAHRIASRTHSAVERADERLGARRASLAALGPAALDRGVAEVVRAEERLVERAARALERRSSTLDVLAARVGAVDPAVQLARGWTITRTARGGIVRSIHDVAAGDVLTTAVADGEVVSVVDDAAPAPAPTPTPAPPATDP